MPDSEERGFRHLGGGRKGLFLLLRYVFIIAASYLLIFREGAPAVEPTTGLMIAVALASNVVLSFIPGHHVFSWYIEAPILVADTIWVSWALHSTGAAGQELFLLYFFVLFLAALGESLVIVLLGSTLVSVANVLLSSEGHFWAPAQLLRITFFYTVALFYGHVLGEIRRERQRADRGFAWARELEAVVAERTADLRHLYQEAQAASRLKSELVANMSHELRTPIHIILGYSEMLLDPEGRERPADEQAIIQRVRRSAQELLDLVDGVLDLGKLEAGKMPVENRQIALDRLVAEVRGRERLPLAPGVEIFWQVPEGLPVVETDGVKLIMVLDNLVNNAIKFTAAGTIAVTVRDCPDSQQVEFCVEDSGPGIAPEHLSVIFEPFHQLECSKGRGRGGVGLGLAIVQRYVALLGGEIRVDSWPPRGTRFTVMLPYHPYQSPQPASPDEAAAA